MRIGIDIRPLQAETKHRGIGKVYTPKYAIVLAAVFSAAVNLCINLVVVFIFAVISGVQFNLLHLAVLPLVIVELIVLAVGISFLLSSLYVKFRDVKYIWELLIQIGFYASAVLYPLSLVPVAYQSLILINPVTQIMQDARYAVVYDGTLTAASTMGQWAFVPYTIVVVVAIISILYFRKGNRFIAEEL